MLSSAEFSMLLEGTATSIYMTLVSTLLAYVIGLPVGICLVVAAPGGLKPRGVLYKVLDVIVNITRSIPFLILMLFVTPLTRLIVGKSYGANATIVSLTLAAAPFIARLVESSLLEVDKGVIEAAQSMGAGTWSIVRKVLLGEARVSLIVGSTIALGTVLGYTAMSGAIGGGGLGDIAIRYGYARWDTRIMWATVVFLVILMQVIQMAGNALSKRLDKRLAH